MSAWQEHFKVVPETTPFPLRVGELAIGWAVRPNDRDSFNLASPGVLVTNQRVMFPARGASPLGVLGSGVAEPARPAFAVEFDDVTGITYHRDGLTQHRIVLSVTDGTTFQFALSDDERAQHWVTILREHAPNAELVLPIHPGPLRGDRAARAVLVGFGVTGLVLWLVVWLVTHR
jgi:hypothetical protein